MGLEADYNIPDRFNMNIEFLRGIADLRKLARVYFLHNELSNYWNVLYRIFLEAGCKFKDTEADEIQKKLDGAITLSSKFMAGKIKPDEIGKLKRQLIEIDSELHKLLNDKGILTAKGEDMGKAMVSAPR
jgi:hypothetical protein